MISKLVTLSYDQKISLGNASSAVATLINENPQQESIKNAYHSVDRFVMQHDHSQSMSIKDALTEADSKWSKNNRFVNKYQSKL